MEFEDANVKEFEQNERFEHGVALSKKRINKERKAFNEAEHGVEDEFIRD